MEADPFLAIKVLKYLADLEANNFSKGAEIIKIQQYVDDICFSAETVEESKLILEEIIKILYSAKLKAHKILCNSLEVTKDLSEDVKMPIQDKNKKNSILGMNWWVLEDVITFKKPKLPVKPVSKRDILSVYAGLYDPVGLLQIVTIIPKLIIQKLWLNDKLNNKVDNWDEPVPQDIETEFIDWVESLSNIENLKIKRSIEFCKNHKTQIISFADASSLIFAACIYNRQINDNNEIKVNLVHSQSKVIPLSSLKKSPFRKQKR